MDGAKSINDSNSEYSLADLKTNLDSIQYALRSNTQSKVTEIPELINKLKQMVQNIHSIPTPILQRLEFVSRQVGIIIPLSKSQENALAENKTPSCIDLGVDKIIRTNQKLPIEMSLHGINVSILNTKGKGRKIKYLGEINGIPVELNTGMFRVLLGINRCHPEKYRLPSIQIRYMRLLASLFPEERLQWKRDKGCWISEKANTTQSEKSREIRGGAKPAEVAKKQVSEKVKSPRPKNIDYSAAPKNPPRAKIKAEAPKAISNYKTTVSGNTLSIQWDGKQTYTLLYQGKSYNVEFKSSEHELLQRILRKETFGIVGNTKTLLDYINLRLERETPFVLAKTDTLYEFILKENIQKKKPLPTGEEKQKISAAYIGGRAPSFSPKDQNMAAKVIRGEE